jgi:ribosomal protein S18 acetylase RimI-like enzyme
VFDAQLLQLRSAGPSDAERIARLHADSWRRHYRGFYSDAFLDGDVEADRRSVWKQRLGERNTDSATVVAESDGSLLGFVHLIFDDDSRCGTLVDNLHVAFENKRRRIGTRLMVRTAELVIERSQMTCFYLRVNEQNTDAQAFYAARGGRCTERVPSIAPGGVASRLTGSPFELRYEWSEPAVLLGYA